MKKILIASTALVMAAGVAQAATSDFQLDGSGYFGLGYYSKPAAGIRKTQLLDRFQVDVNGSKTTDSGLTFYGKYRIRSNAYQAGPGGSGTTSVNGGQVGIKAGGLDVAVGNVSDAIDALTLYWNSEIGLCGCGGETLNFVGFDGYSSTGAGANGVLVTYTMGNLAVRGSYQSHTNTTNAKGEAAVSVAYKVGALSMEAGYVKRPHGAAAGTAGYTGATIVFEYALGNSNIGFAAGQNKNTSAAGVKAANINVETLYGNTKFGATTVQAFVSHANNLPAADSSTTYGIGAKYDLGSGAAIVGSVRKDWNKATYADLGASFSF